jgi:hypothetical protein
MASAHSSSRPCHQRTGVNQAITATVRQAGTTKGSRTQNTGAPISRSRKVPPPTPVMKAKNATVTKVCRICAAESAPVRANTAMPRISKAAGRAGVSGGMIVGIPAS